MTDSKTLKIVRGELALSREANRSLAADNDRLRAELEGMRPANEPSIREAPSPHVTALRRALSEIILWWRDSNACFGEASFDLYASAYEPMRAAQAALDHASDVELQPGDES